MAATRHVVLVGMMGVGKTTVGQVVAKRLGRPFLDSDVMIEQHEGRTVREIWLAEGEPAYRVLETEVLREALAAAAPAVIAAAGGVVLREENRRLLQGPRACTVRLDADPELLATHVGNQVHRPLLDSDPLATLRRLSDERDALYNEVAYATVEVAGRDVESIATDVIAALTTAEGAPA